MRSTNRKRALLISSAVILLCMSIIVGMTYALFTDNVTQNHHLQAGKLDITLTRTRLESTYLDTTTGRLVEATPNTVRTDFSNTSSTDANVFGMTPGVSTLVVPQCEYTVNMEISNNSDVAFNYWVEVVYKDADGNTLDKNDEFAKQVSVTLVRGQNTFSDEVYDELNVGAEDDPIATVEKSGKDNFTLTVKFEDLSDNNDVMEANIKFDIVVHAVQVEAP